MTFDLRYSVPELTTTASETGISSRALVRCVAAGGQFGDLRNDSR